ncbi:hypothetical protein PQX77_018752 [Marasmius sp. AFHP31]|nr:hypothetical protein PQX77_018752 [Marasmius sp. AFHP31]
MGEVDADLTQTPHQRAMSASARALTPEDLKFTEPEPRPVCPKYTVPRPSRHAFIEEYSDEETAILKFAEADTKWYTEAERWGSEKGREAGEEVLAWRARERAAKKQLEQFREVRDGKGVDRTPIGPADDHPTRYAPRPVRTYGRKVPRGLKTVSTVPTLQKEKLLLGSRRERGRAGGAGKPELRHADGTRSRADNGDSGESGGQGALRAAVEQGEAHGESACDRCRAGGIPCYTFGGAQHGRSCCHCGALRVTCTRGPMSESTPGSPKSLPTPSPEPRARPELRANLVAGAPSGLVVDSGNESAASLPARQLISAADDIHQLVRVCHAVLTYLGLDIPDSDDDSGAESVSED